MKNWRTTLAGLVFAAYPVIDALIKAYQAGYFTDKTGGQLWLGIGIVAIGVLAKDKNVTGVGEAAKTKDEVQSILGTDRPNDR